MPEITTRLTNLRAEDLSYYLAFARKANRQLRTIQNEIKGTLHSGASMDPWI